VIDLGSGWVTGVGSLPHRDPGGAVADVFRHCDLVYVPQLPARSANEGMIAQAVAWVPGISVSSAGGITVSDPPCGAAIVDIIAGDPIDLDHDSFDTFVSPLGVATLLTAPPSAVKWQLVGPVTLGLAMHRSGLPASIALPTATLLMARTVAAVHSLVAGALPTTTQVVVLDEPCFATEQWMSAESIDAVASVLGIVGRRSVGGVHCCAEADWTALLATGASLLSLPMSPSVIDHGPEFGRFLERGGWVAWGAVPTDAADSAAHYWKQLGAQWAALCLNGCDYDRLRAQALLTPACGLAMRTEAQAAHVMRLTRAVGDAVTGAAGIGPS
jgi:hypothetical protein